MDGESSKESPHFTKYTELRITIANFNKGVIIKIPTIRRVTMFCNHCGSQVPDGAAFCNNCGNSVNAAPQAQMHQFQNQKNAIRQSEIAALENVLAYFSKKRSEFAEYDLVCMLVNDFAGGAKKSLLVWGCIILTAGLLMLTAGADALVGALIAFVLPGAAMMTGGILMQVNNKKKYHYFQSEYARLSQELYEYYMAFPNCPVGPEYANPEILELILGVLLSGRADTIKESINLLIADANQSEMNAYIQAIEQNTAQINTQTRVAAVFAAANFFK